MGKVNRKTRIKLQIGKWYRLPLIEDRNDSESKKSFGRKMKLVEKHPHVATFIDAYGIVRSYQYWLIGKVLRGEEV